MKRIIIDTNAWMAFAEFKLDLFSALERDCDFAYTLTTLQEVVNELEKIVSEQRAKYRQAALLALGIIKTKKVQIIPGTGKVDDLLVEHSKKGDIVLTQDVILKRRLHKPYLTIRQKKKIIEVR